MSKKIRVVFPIIGAENLSVQALTANLRINGHHTHMVFDPALFDDKNFAITDLSHSRAIIEIEGDLADEIIKKGCPLNINELGKKDCANSSFHGITVTIDFLSNDPKKIRLLALRSFGESLYHSVSDACLEYGYKAV